MDRVALEMATLLAALLAALLVALRHALAVDRLAAVVGS